MIRLFLQCLNPIDRASSLSQRSSQVTSVLGAARGTRPSAVAHSACVATNDQTALTTAGCAMAHERQRAACGLGGLRLRRLRLPLAPPSAIRSCTSNWVSSPPLHIDPSLFVVRLLESRDTLTRCYPSPSISLRSPSSRKQARETRCYPQSIHLSS